MVIEYFYQGELMVNDFEALDVATEKGKVFITFSDRKGDYLVINANDIFSIRRATK